MAVPDLRIRAANDAPVRGGGDWVLYWMIAARRPSWNFGLQRAAETARELRLPLVVLEALRVGYPHANDRLHRFVIDGMADNAARIGRRALHVPYVESVAGEGKGLLEALAARSALVVTDDFPAFFLPRMVRAAAARLPVRLEAVDSNGLLPLRAAERVFTTARSFRLFLQRNLARHLAAAPEPDPLHDLPVPPRVPAAIARRWPAAAEALLRGDSAALARLPIDHSVGIVRGVRGGVGAAREALQRFVREGLPGYAERQRHPDEHATSGLSPYLHFGHVSAHEVLDAVGRALGRTPWPVDEKRGGARVWWGVGEDGEAFLEQLVTWRELGLNFCAFRDDAHTWEAVPPWARRTLDKHAGDARPALYDMATLEQAQTGDVVWNAAQRELLREGRIHNQLRMLWGKKVLEWSPDPQEALRRLVQLNDRWALDGRDPNSYSGITWVFGHYDRPWGPERPVYGTVRYMSSANATKKLRMRRYLATYGA